MNAKGLHRLSPLCGVLCLVASLSWAQAETKAPEAQRPSLWVQPVMPYFLNTLFIPRGEYLVTLPMGLSLPQRGKWKQWELMFEVTPIYRSDRATYPRTPVNKVFALALAGGAAWFRHEGATHQGFFLHPKLVGAISHDPRGSPLPSRSLSLVASQLSLGLDIGRRYAFRGGHLDLLVGGSVGWGWNVPAESPSLFYSVIGGRSPRRTSKLVWDPNFHLLRIGLTF